MWCGIWMVLSPCVTYMKKEQSGVFLSEKSDSHQVSTRPCLYFSYSYLGLLFCIGLSILHFFHILCSRVAESRPVNLFAIKWIYHYRMLVCECLKSRADDSEEASPDGDWTWNTIRSNTTPNGKVLLGAPPSVSFSINYSFLFSIGCFSGYQKSEYLISFCLVE